MLEDFDAHVSRYPNLPSKLMCLLNGALDYGKGEEGRNLRQPLSFRGDANTLPRQICFVNFSRTYEVIIIPPVQSFFYGSHLDVRFFFPHTRMQFNYDRF